MNNEKLNVYFDCFVGDEDEEIDSSGVIHYMGTPTNDRGIDLNAEIEVPNQYFNDEGQLISKEFKNYGYDKLKAKIIKQAIKKGLNPEILNFINRIN